MMKQSRLQAKGWGSRAWTSIVRRDRGRRRSRGWAGSDHRPGCPASRSWRSKIEVAQVGAAASGTSPSSCCAADRRDTVKQTGCVTDRASAETNDFEKVIVLG
jgi:hypothetical protein